MDRSDGSNLLDWWTRTQSIRTAATSPIEVAGKILECLDLPPGAPPLGPAPDESAWHERESRGE